MVPTKRYTERHSAKCWIGMFNIYNNINPSETDHTMELEQYKICTGSHQGTVIFPL